MKRAQNAMFVLLCCVLFALVPGYILLGATGVIAIQDRSPIEGRDYTDPPSFNSESISNGVFQKQADKYISDHVPARDTIILANAAMERETIKFANVTFNWECYPTKFDSKFVEIPSLGMIIRTAPEPSKNDLEKAERWVAAVKDAKAKHPDVRFVYDVLDDTYTSKHNPTRKYVTRHWENEWISAHVCNALSASDVEVIYDSIDSEEEISSLWFKTEHHWTLERALISYNRMGSLLGWDAVSWEGEFEVTNQWFGSSARSGLDLNYSDALRDIPTDYSGLSCQINGKSGYRGMKEKISRGIDAPTDFGNPPTNAFSSYYGGVVGESIWDNSSKPNGQTCLFVEQSYGPPLEPYIARNYDRVVCVDPLNRKNPKSLDEYIEEYDADVVVVQLGVRDLHKISENSPSWTS